METGYYKRSRFNWSAYEVDVFVPYLFTEYSGGCGANTLSLLTGVSPLRIKNPNKKRPDHWDDTTMINFLKKRGFRVKHITKCDVTREKIEYGFACNFITDKHVIMCSQLMNRNSASWTVIHNNLLYHNFATTSFRGLTLFNSPSLTCYLLWHPNWKVKR